MTYTRIPAEEYLAIEQLGEADVRERGGAERMLPLRASDRQLKLKELRADI